MPNNYEPIASKEAAKIIDKYWLKDGKGGLRYTVTPSMEFEFLYFMKKAQIELIEMHFHSMSREDKERAIKELKRLKG